MRTGTDPETGAPRPRFAERPTIETKETHPGMLDLDGDGRTVAFEGRDMRVARRRTAAALAILAVSGLSGCGDGDADRRKAFTAFLQTRIVDKPGLHVPQLTDDEKRAFGPYADQYAIITGFHRVMNDSVTPQFSAAMTKGAIQSLGDLFVRRADIQTAKTTLDGMATALRADVAQADEARGKLTQPEDVKAVFDKAYDRLVTTVAATFGAVVPVADKVFSETLALTDYLDRHKDRVTVSGSMLQVSDPKVQGELNARLQALQGDQRAVQEAQGRFQTLVYGTGG